MSLQPLLPDDPPRLGPWVLEGRQGAGGMGAVYLSRSPATGLVAVKLMHHWLASDPEYVGDSSGSRGRVGVVES
jgi:hypothetical protein